MTFAEQTFDSVTLELDGNSYRKCVFRNVLFVYGGGELIIEDCAFESFSWQFTGDLARGLFALYQLFGTERMLTIIRGFTEPKAGVVEL